MQPNEQLEKYIRNERLNRRITTAMVPLFVIMSIGIVYLLFQSQETNKELELAKSELKNRLTELALLTDSIDVVHVRYKLQVESLLDTLKIHENASISRTGNSIVYIQYRDNRDIKIVDELTNRLENGGYNVRAAEKINANFKSDLRYFHESDKLMAESIAELSKNIAGFDGVSLRPNLMQMASPPGQIEIWINSSMDNLSKPVGKQLPPEVEKTLVKHRLSSKYGKIEID